MVVSLKTGTSADIFARDFFINESKQLFWGSVGKKFNCVIISFLNWKIPVSILINIDAFIIILFLS